VTRDDILRIKLCMCRERVEIRAEIAAVADGDFDEITWDLSPPLPAPTASSDWGMVLRSSAPTNSRIRCARNSFDDLPVSDPAAASGSKRTPTLA
jgi:hypothetical protein